MKASIGGISLMNIFIVFFIMVTFFLFGTVLYYKGFKINSQIANSLEKYEGYNSYSANDMDRVFSNLGYRQEGSDSICGESSSGESLMCLSDNRNYEFELTCSKSDKNVSDQYEGRNYYIQYKIKTYIYIDMPFDLSLKIPITTKTNPIYQFTKYENGLGC